MDGPFIKISDWFTKKIDVNLVYAPEEKMEVALAMFEDLPSKKRGFRRFSTWQRKFWMKLMEARDSRIARLEKRVKELEEENRNLRFVPHI